jgi:hypothetical protein
MSVVTVYDEADGSADAVVLGRQPVWNTDLFYSAAQQIKLHRHAR